MSDDRSSEYRPPSGGPSANNIEDPAQSSEKYVSGSEFTNIQEVHSENQDLTMDVESEKTTEEAEIKKAERDAVEGDEISDRKNGNKQEQLIEDHGQSTGSSVPESEITETRKTNNDTSTASMNPESKKIGEDEENYLDCDGIGKMKKGSKQERKIIGNIDDILTKELCDSKSGATKMGASTLPGVGSIQGPASASAMGPVTVFNFGRVEITGTTDDVVIGDKAEYLNSVTVQQIVHEDEEGMLRAAGDSAVRRRRGLSGETSPKTARRTGMVLRENGCATGSEGDGKAKTGNGLLFRHLLGRKVETSAWIPIALLSCITFVVVTICSLIFGIVSPKRDEVTPSIICKPSEHAECPQTPFKKNSEALPKLQRTLIIPRIMWQARQPMEMTRMKHPVEYVVISHTAAEPCYNQTECLEQVRIIQKYHMDSREWSDIGYNFLVGGDGNAYEGRGWEYVGAHAKGYNAVSIGISFIGTFTDVLPPPAQIRACKLLIKEGVIQKKISKDYKLIAHRQVSPTESPGEKLYEELQNWEHWSSEVL